MDKRKVEEALLIGNGWGIVHQHLILDDQCSSPFLSTSRFFNPLRDPLFSNFALSDRYYLS